MIVEMERGTTRGQVDHVVDKNFEKLMKELRPIAEAVGIFKV